MEENPQHPLRVYEDNPLEKVYFVLEGELTVKSKTEEFVLRKGDSLFLGPNEGRELLNAANMPASMLVVVNYKGGTRYEEAGTRSSETWIPASISSGTGGG